MQFQTKQGAKSQTQTRSLYMNVKMHNERKKADKK
jgi:hypothetical protein